MSWILQNVYNWFFPEPVKPVEKPIEVENVEHQQPFTRQTYGHRMTYADICKMTPKTR